MDDVVIQTAVKTTVEAFIREHNLDAKIIGFEDWDEWPRIRVEVAREDYEKIFSVDCFFDDFSVQWEQRVPPLVGAEVGDLVLVYEAHSSKDEDSDVALVSAKFTSEDGSVCYGCRHIQIGLNNQFVNDMYDFELTQDNYGGHPEGFLKVLTPQEAVEHLRRHVKIAQERELANVQSKFERTDGALETLTASLGKTKKVQCEKVEFDDHSMPFSLKIDK